MAIGRTYPIKKSAVKAYGYTKPPKKRAAGFRRNGGVTHIAAINGRGAYSARTRMSGLSKNQRSAAARSSLTAAKKSAFARKMRGIKSGGMRRNSSVKNAPRIKRTLPGYSANKSKFRKNNNTAAYHRRADAAFARRSASPPSRFASARAHERAREARIDLASGTRKPKNKSRRRVGPARRGTTKKSASTKGTVMARKVRRKNKSAARKPVRRVKRRKASRKRSAVAPKRRVKRRRKARKSTQAAAPKRKRRRKAKKTTLKANRRRRSRRLKRNYGTSAGARKGWKKRRSAAKSAPKRRRRRKARTSSTIKRRKRSGRRLKQSKSARAARRRYRAKKAGLKPNRRRRVRRNARKATPNRRRRLRRNRRRALSPNRRRRSSRRRMSSNRRHRRNGRRRSMFRKNGIMDPIVTVLKTGAIALGGFGAHKIVSNLFTTQILNRIFGSPATVVVTPAATTAVAPATSGLGGLNIDPQYQRLAGSFIVAALGVFATTKLVKDQATRNTLITGMSVSFAHSVASALVAKFAPQYSGLLAGPEDGTAARLSAMYGMRGLGGGTSIQPHYAPINGMGEYFGSGVSGLGEYFDSGVSGLGEYFSSGMSGLGAYQAAAGYGSNPDMAEAAAGYGATSMPGNHIDPHGDLDREMNIAEAAAGVGGMGAVQSYEASAGFGAISSLPSASTWIPGSSNGQIWAGTRSISSPQSATEMVPAGILQTDGGSGVFG